MDLTLFSVLVGLGIILIFLGYYTKEKAYSLIGCSFLFILGFWVLMPAGLTTQTGLNISYTYNNATLISSLETPITTAFNDSTSRFFGVWLALIGIAGAAISLTEIRRGI